MAFIDSIKWNGKSIRDFSMEVIRVEGRGKPPISRNTLDIEGRHGVIAFGAKYMPRTIDINGYVEGTLHASMIANLNSLKDLFAMSDNIMALGNQQISDLAQDGKLEFGDETDRYYKAQYDGIFGLRDISHKWMGNNLIEFTARFISTDPFKYSTALTEATMNGSADEFKVFDTGNVFNECDIDIIGAVTNPVIVTGDKIGVAHFDYDDDLRNVENTNVAGNFTSAFGFRTRKSLTTQMSKAIQIANKDNLYYDRGANINGQNYANFNLYQGTIILWVKPYFDGDDSKNHMLFRTIDAGNNIIQIQKNSGNGLRGLARLGGTSRAAAITGLDSANWAKGTWYMIALRWDLNNTIDASSNFVQIDLLNSAEENGNTSALVAPTDQDQFLAIGQNYDTTPDGTIDKFDGLIHWQLFERALTDSEVSDQFNSGSGVEPVVTPDTKLLSAGELSSGDPVSVQYPYVDNLVSNGNQEDDPITNWSDSGFGGGSGSEAIETAIVKYDLQSTKIIFTTTNNDQNVRMTTGSLTNNQDYFYRFWVYVESLSASVNLYLTIVGSAAIVDKRQLNTGTDDIGVSFATGKWLYFEGTFEADQTGTHQIRFPATDAGAGANSATFYIDQIDVQSNLIDKPNFSGAFTGGLNDAWTQKGSITSTQETTLVHSGANAQKVVTIATNAGILQAITFVANKWYTLSVWARGGASTDDLILAVTGLSDAIGNLSEQFNDLGTTYVKKSITFKTGSDTSGVVEIYSPNNGDTSYYDDVSLIELDEVVANAASVPTPEIDQYSEQKFGQGLLINGADTLSWALKGNPSEGSIEAWFTPDFDADWNDDTDDPIICELYASSVNLLRLYYDWTNDQFVFRKRRSTNFEAVSAAQTFVAGDRIHIIGTWGSVNGVQIYVNGVAGTADSNTTILTATLTNLYMSDQAQTIFPDSIIDEIYAYSRELSQQEVTERFNAIKTVKLDNRVFGVTRTYAVDDKVIIHTEPETLEFLDSSGGTVVNDIASMNSGSQFPRMPANKAVIYNKVAATDIDIKFRKRYL